MLDYPLSVVFSIKGMRWLFGFVLGILDEFAPDVAHVLDWMVQEGSL